MTNQGHRNHSAPIALTRRQALAGMAAGIAGLAWPARAQRASQQKVSLTLPGGKQVSAALFLPLTLPAPAVVVAPDRFGLIDAMLERAGSLSFEHYIVVAVDLYDGAVASDVAQAQVLQAALDSAVALNTVLAWSDWVRADARCNRNIGLMGFGLGGGLALDAALTTNSLGTVLYYSPISRKPEQLLRLTGPVLGHYSERDAQFPISAQEDAQFVLQKLNKRSRLYHYAADGDFANAASPSFSRSDALLAWNRSVAFLHATVGAGGTG